MIIKVDEEELQFKAGQSKDIAIVETIIEKLAKED